MEKSNDGSIPSPRQRIPVATLPLAILKQKGSLPRIRDPSGLVLSPINFTNNDQSREEVSRNPLSPLTINGN